MAPHLFALFLLASALLGGCGAHKEARPKGEFPAPRQTAILGTKAPIQLEDGVWVVLRTNYEVDAYVMATKQYRRAAKVDVAPVDLVLGWGVIALPQNVNRVRVTQAEREHQWRAADEDLIHQVGPRAIDLGLANTHMIPADEAIRDTLLSAEPGDALKATGYLVDVRSRESTKFQRTSIRRDDKGPGSGELFYVTSATLLSPGF